MYSEKGVDIIKSIFGNGNKNNLPEGVKSRYGIGTMDLILRLVNLRFIIYLKIKKHLINF